MYSSTKSTQVSNEFGYQALHVMNLELSFFAANS